MLRDARFLAAFGQLMQYLILCLHHAAYRVPLLSPQLDSLYMNEVAVLGPKMDPEDPKRRCRECSKLFRSAHFVQKHVANKHAEDLDKARKAVSVHCSS